MKLEQLGTDIPLRRFGNTGLYVTCLCLGGYHVGAAARDDGESTGIKLIQEAIDSGIQFLDNAWDYHDGYAEEVMGKAIKDRRDKVFLMTKNCGRDRKQTEKCLDDSLRRLKVDYLDLWQFHEINYDNDPEMIFQNGAIDAAIKARKAGKVKFIGFTGHKHPSIHLKMLKMPFEWDSIQMPINVCDSFYRSFARHVVPACRAEGVACIGMKSMGGGAPTIGKIIQSGLITAEECIRYSLAQHIDTLAVGIRDRKQLRTALRAAKHTMMEDEQEALRNRMASVAGDGRYELFKSDNYFDGDYHRKQHGLHPVERNDDD